MLTKFNVLVCQHLFLTQVNHLVTKLPDLHGFHLIVKLKQIRLQNNPRTVPDPIMADEPSN
jgi:hypothetical protein